MLLSEYALGTPAMSANFPKRNRIIAGLARGTLVVEAALRSGSLITARLAAEQGKDVFAIPGSIHSAQARGCHALIRQGAKLVESAEDILEEMKFESAAAIRVSLQNEPSVAAEEPGLSPAEAHLLQALGFDPTGLDALQARTGLDTPALQAQLMALELQGHLVRLPGGLFQRMARA
jgi:DNA processing protein